MKIPYDTILIIFHHLPITDKRNLMRTCKDCINLSDLIKRAAKEFYKTLCRTAYVAREKISSCSLYGYTVELLFDEYVHLIPNRYITNKNDALYEDPNIYFNSAARCQISILKLLVECNKNLSTFITCGCAAGGHLELLKWAKKKGCNWDSTTCSYAASNGHLKLLRWAIKNGCKWNNEIGNSAAENGHRRCYSGRGKMDANGIDGYLLMRGRTIIWRF